MPSKESLDKAMRYLIDVYRFDGDNQATLADLLDEAMREARLAEAEWWKKFYVDEFGVSDSAVDRRLTQLREGKP